MIIVDCQQGSHEWVTAKIGVPSASNFDRILTPKTMKLSASIDAYAYQLLAEQALGYPMDAASSGFMERGKDMERHAVAFYELQRDVTTEPVGFVLRDDRRVGCSPDRFVGPDGLLEIKCPSAAVHIGYLLDGGIGYRAQVQGQLWLCERDWIDTLSYHPELPCAPRRETRDEAFIAALSSAVDQFLAYMDDLKERLQRCGMFEGERVPDLQVIR